MGVSLEPITTEEQVETLIPLVQEIWREWYTPIIGAEQVVYMLGAFQSHQEILRQVKGDVSYFFIVHDGQEIGYTAYELSDDRLFISKIYILASQRGRGYASQVFHWLEAQALAFGKTTLELHVNQDNRQSINVYERRGFKNRGELISDIGNGFKMIDYVFEKKLALTKKEDEIMKIGVMGLGNIAQKAYVPIMDELRGEVDWHFYSRDEIKMQKLAKEHGWQSVYTNKEAFLASGLDACFVHTPTETHGALIEELLGLGIHVFVDKPVSEDYQEVADLHRLAEERGLLLMTGFNRRFAPLNQQLKAVPTKNMIIAQKNRMQPKGKVKFEVFDMLIHVVDTVLYLLDDDIIDVRYQLSALADGTLKRAMITFETATTTAIASTNMEAGAHTETVEVHSLDGTYLVSNLDQLTKNEHGHRSVTGFGDWEDTLTKRGFRGVIEAFIEALRTGKASPVTTASTSLLSHYYIAQLVADSQEKDC